MSVTRLVSIRIDTNFPDGVGNLSNIICDLPDHRVRGWRILLRGPAVFLVTPPGWKPGLPAPARDSAGPITVYEVPRSQCVIRWEGVDGIDNVAKHDTPPMCSAEERKMLEIAEIERMERATAPATKNGGGK